MKAKWPDIVRGMKWQDILELFTQAERDVREQYKQLIIDQAQRIIEKHNDEEREAA